MAIIVEDGTGKADAESYISVSELDTFFSLWGYSITATTGEKETLLRRSAMFLDGKYNFDGLPTTSTQALSWPRTGCYTDNGCIVASNIIPAKIKNAQAELAYQMTKIDLTEVKDNNVSAESFGPVSFTYRQGDDSDIFKGRSFPSVDVLIKAYLSAPCVRLSRG